MEVSIIVPAYNEEKRIFNFLPHLIAFSKNNLKDYEIIAVNDGSIDKTSDVINQFKKQDKRIKLISYANNMGKGYAVREGVFFSKGKKVLFIDADGSTMPDQIPSMLKELDNYECVVGNRMDKRSKVLITRYRAFTQKLFNLLVKILFNSEIDDNLCGFKGFKSEIARDIFYKLHDYGWIFDVELFYKIKKRGYSLKRIPVEWKWVGESKIKITDPFWMFLKLLRLLRLRVPTLIYENGKNRESEI